MRSILLGTATLVWSMMLLPACADESATKSTNTYEGGQITNAADAISAFCQGFTACVMGNAADGEACVVELSAEVQTAEVYGCSPPMSAMLGCIQHKAVCETGLYTVGASCIGLSNDYHSCEDNATAPAASPPMVAPVVISVCSAFASCLGNSTLEELSCQIDQQRELDRAAVYGCTAEMESFVSCVDTNATCDGGFVQLTLDCHDLYQDAVDCMQAASNLAW